MVFVGVSGDFVRGELQVFWPTSSWHILIIWVQILGHRLETNHHILGLQEDTIANCTGYTTVLLTDRQIERRERAKEAETDSRLRSKQHEPQAFRIQLLPTAEALPCGLPSFTLCLGPGLAFVPQPAKEGHGQGTPGVCLSTVLQAAQWRSSPPCCRLVANSR